MPIVDKPIFTMLVGLPASGKSTYAAWEWAITHSSDALRQELYGDVNCQEKNADLFAILHQRIKDDLRNGSDCIYDATNIDKKKRTAFLAELKNIPCHKKCIVFMTPYEVCLEQNQKRDRRVPEEVIRRMYLKWSPPNYAEGFDEIEIIYNYGDEATRLKYTVPYFFEGDNGIDNMSQENNHHTLSLGHHCKVASKYIEQKHPSNKLLQIATLLHDIGKAETKTTLNSRGVNDGNCHYYCHENVSSYLSFFFTDCMGIGTKAQIYIANLIYYHMRPYTSWKQSEKAMKKNRDMIGASMFCDVMRLHEADVAAH